MAVAIAEVVVPVRRSSETVDIAQRLRLVWLETHLTAREVAVGMGLTSPESFRQYLKGNIVNWPAAVPKLARGLRMEPAELSARLGVEFDPQAAVLEERIYRMLAPERLDKAGEIFDALVALPPELQDKALEMMRVSVQGLRADLPSDASRQG